MAETPGGVHGNARASLINMNRFGGEASKAQMRLKTRENTTTLTESANILGV